MSSSKRTEVLQIPRSEHSRVDTPSKLASAVIVALSLVVNIERLTRPSTKEEVMDLDTTLCWMCSTFAFLRDNIMLEKKEDAREVEHHSSEIYMGW